MKWKLWKLPESPMPLYYWVKFLGLAPFAVKNNRFYPPNLVDRLYPMAVAVGYTTFVSLLFVPTVWKEMAKRSHVGIGDLWRGSRHLTTSTVTLCAIFGLSLSYKKILSLMNTLGVIGYELETLGVREDRGKMWKNIYVELLTSNIVTIVMGILMSVTDDQLPLVFFVHHNIGCWFNLNTFLIYSKILDCISRRFELLNDRLTHLCFPNACARSPPNLKMLVISRRLRGDDVLRPYMKLTKVELMRKIAAVHLDLCNIVGQTVALFTIPILLNAYDFLSVLTISCCWLYSVVRTVSDSCDDDIPALKIGAIVYPILRIAMMIYGPLVIANASAGTCKRGNATAGVLFKVWKKFKPVELKNEFIMFSVQMMQKPLIVSVWSVIDLDHLYIYKIVCAGVAYSFVMIQMDGSPVGCS